MEKAMRFAKIVRNNWKKSVCGVIALYYGAATVKERYEINLLMRAACKEASKYGDYTLPIDQNPTMVTVILNPVANKRKAKQDYEKYCEPLLHLAGLQVSVIQTASEGNAKEIVETLRGTEAIVVAGGDGTLSETITGLLRRNDHANQFPIGVLPLGRTNTLGNTLFPSGKGVEKVKQLISASMAIIKGNTVWKDAMKIEPIEQNPESPNKPIYAMCSLEWGAFRDAFAKRDRYWMYGSLRDYASFIFNGYKDSLNWRCIADLKFSPPCAGCSNCLKKRPEIKRKWSFFMPSVPQVHDQALVENQACETKTELSFKTTDFRIRTPNVEQVNSDPPGLLITIGKKDYTYKEFVSEGWDRVKQDKISDALQARSVELIPKIPDKETVIEIDKEEYEAKPIRITLLPKVIRVFCARDQ
ncbi:acylglycerol kinase, mitochondrial [Trichoplusia ni]|uniref:Acylglycerol kinase, mitochondrial n=1 Tax=Trichoplusia ni TaxID=7111 RepID=A0A7E5VY05_TRINI|nr:acylglycerol kinase, mitochondrial [Trichoplusia ni]XP_026733219.1 acylglycerol kinase, mitochondrial [Trichoplusia ni]